MRKTIYLVLMTLALFNFMFSCKPAEQTTTTTDTAVATDTVATDTVATDTAATTTAVSPSEFVTTAGQASMTEVAAGKLALEKSKNTDLRRFAEWMIADHTLLNEQLKRLAEKEGIPFPKDMGEQNRQMIDALSKLSGAEFDAMYANDMVTGHQGAVGLFQGESAAGTNPAIQGWATQFLPMIQAHLTGAEYVQSHVK